MKTTIKTKFKKAIEIHIQPLYKIYDTLGAAKACNNIHRREYDTLKQDYDTLKEQRDKCIEALKDVIKHLNPTDIDFKEGSVGSIKMATNRCGVADLSLDKAIITAIQLIKNNSK